MNATLPPRTETEVLRYWSYCVDKSGSVVLVHHTSRDAAYFESQLMKGAIDVRTVGYTTARGTEADMREKCRRRGWTVSLVRGVNPNGR